MSLTFPAWQRLIDQLTQEERVFLFQLVEERLQEIVQERAKFQEEKQKSMTRDHQKLQTVYQKLKF